MDRCRKTLLGLAESCAVGDVDAAATEVVARASEGTGGYVCLCNVHVLTLALRNADLHAALTHAWKRYPDGAPVAWLQRRAGRATAHRIGGPDLMPRVIDLGRERGLRHYLLGSTDEVLSEVHTAVEAAYPGAEVVGRHSPPFDGTGHREALDAIRAARPDVVWCALGAPKQEVWMHRSAPLLPGILLVGVGAAFDFIAGSRTRAPKWMQHTGFEWLHRLASEPLGWRAAIPERTRSSWSEVVSSSCDADSSREHLEPDHDPAPCAGDRCCPR